MSISFLVQKTLLTSLIKALLLICLVSPTAALAVTVGEPAPLFQLEGLNKRIYRLQDFKNKVVFVNFWASWCSPCRKELPLLDELQARHEELLVVAINIDSEKENALRFIDDFRIKSLVLFDSKTEVVNQFGAMAMPTSYILDKDGVIRYLHYGFNAKKDPDKWDAEVTSLLEASK